MSYARFAEDKSKDCKGSDVYVWMGFDHKFYCQCCSIVDGDGWTDFICQTRHEMLAHLFDHHEKGHYVPQRAFAQLIKEIAEIGE